MLVLRSVATTCIRQSGLLCDSVFVQETTKQLILYPTAWFVYRPYVILYLPRYLPTCSEIVFETLDTSDDNLSPASFALSLSLP